MLQPTKPVNIVEKSWGREIWIHNDKDYCGKILEIYLGKECSLHYHLKKKETFYVLQGNIKMTTVTERGEISYIRMAEGDVFEVSRRMRHKFKGLNRLSKIIEVSTQHFDHDSYRIV